MLKTNLGPTTPTAPARQTALTAERSTRLSDDATNALPPGSWALIEHPQHGTLLELEAARVEQ